jgi:transposase
VLSNAMRGLAAEFGLIIPKGIHKLVELMALVDSDERVPKQARQAGKELLDQREAVGERIETLEAEIVAHARQDKAARQLAVPGAGRYGDDPIQTCVARANVVALFLL